MNCAALPETLIEIELLGEDIYYRLNIFPIYLPPLRERRADVLLLADFSLLPNLQTPANHGSCLLSPWNTTLKTMGKELIIDALKASQGNIAHALSGF